MSTGAKAYIKYGWESEFRGGSLTKDKVFGRGVRVTGVTLRENLENIYELYERTVSNGVFKQMEGLVGLEWILANPWAFKAVMGAVNTGGASAPYTHTFTRTKDFVSMALEIGSELEGENVVRTLLGAVVDSITVTGAIGEALRVRMDMPFYEEGAVGSTISAPNVDGFEPFTFVQATLKMPSAGNAIAQVQTFEITIRNNALAVYGLGNKYAAKAVPQGFDAEARLAVTMKNADFLDVLRTEVADVEFKITNGLTGANEVSITFTGTGVLVGEHTVAYEPNAIVIEDLPLIIRNLTVVAINAVSACP